MKGIELAQKLFFTKYMNILLKIPTEVLPSLPKRLNFRQHFSAKPVRNSSTGSIKTFSSFFNFFSLYLEYSQVLSHAFYEPHKAYKLLFNVYSKGNMFNINPQSLLNRWKTTVLLLSNLAHFQIKSFSFGNKFLWKEILALNKPVTLNNLLFVKYIKKIVFFKDSPWTDLSLASWKKLKKVNVSTSFIWDVWTNKHNIRYLKLMNYTLIALTPRNVNPWEFHFPIPTSSSNLLIQYYFINIFIYINQTIRAANFFNLKKLWFTTYI
jgi:hypothetical protein